MKTQIMIGLIGSLFSAGALAHCPMEISVGSESYCLDLQWLEADRKVQGNFEPAGQESPQLIRMGEIPQRWIYSKAHIQIWNKSDSTHEAQQIEGLEIYPYMAMENGHHHGTSFDFLWNEATQSYELSHMGLQAMRGCWSLKWRMAPEQEQSQGKVLMNLVDYKNLSAEENQNFAQFCGSAADSSGDNGNHQGGGHHHGPGGN